MSKKVLIIRSTVAMKDSHLNRDAKTLIESIVNTGIVILPDNYTYEFGQIDGVVWEGEKQEKKPNVDLDAIIKEIEDLIFEESKDVAESAWNNALKRSIRIIKEKTNE